MTDSAPRLALGTLVLLGLGAWGSRQYVVPDPWAPYNEMVRDYLGAGLRNDSAVLRREAATAQPAVWVRNVARRQPGRLAAWTRDLSGVAGERHGDTVAVVLAADENLSSWQRRPEGPFRAQDPERCAVSSTVSALLIHQAAGPRVVALSSPCLDAEPLQVLHRGSALLP